MSPVVSEVPNSKVRTIETCNRSAQSEETCRKFPKVCSLFTPPPPLPPGSRGLLSIPNYPPTFGGMSYDKQARNRSDDIVDAIGPLVVAERWYEKQADTGVPTSRTELSTTLLVARFPNNQSPFSIAAAGRALNVTLREA
ncbi:unnamed protein product [Calypogeia fissa]